MGVSRFPNGLGFVKPGLVGANTAAYTFLVDDATPSVKQGVYWVCAESAITITNFDDGELGQMIFVKNGDATNILQHSAGGIFFSSSATNLSMGTNQLIQFINDGTSWIEVTPRN